MPVPQDFFAASVVHVGQGHLAEGLVLAAMVVILDEVV
jgi:hypothetical protein